MRRELTAGKARALLDRIRPGDDVARIRLQLAEDHLADIRALDARLKTAAAQISDLVTATGTTLTSLFGVGPLTAGRILAETGDVSRFATKDKFASYNGTAPIDVSSGDQVRHRLSRAGNRRINHVLHMMAVTQIRYPWTDGRRYYERKRAEGKTPRKHCAASNNGSPTRSPGSRPRPAGHNRRVRITYDPAADAAYIYLTGERLARGRTVSIPADPPEGVQAFIVLDWKEDASSASRSSTPAADSTPTSSRKRKSSADNGTS
jgi:hypothetical protein